MFEIFYLAFYRTLQNAADHANPWSSGACRFIVFYLRDFRWGTKMRARGLLFFVSILIIALSSSGCSWFANSATGTLATGAPANNVDTLRADSYVAEFDQQHIDTCNQLKTKACRNDIINYRISYYDSNYYIFQRLIFSGSAAYNSSTDIAVLGLSAAGTLVGGATTKAILAAISGGLVGTRGIIEKDVLFNASMSTLIAQMDADRATQYGIIAKNQNRSFADYPLSAAEIDADKYYKVGTIPSAIQSILQNAGTQKTAGDNVAVTAKSGGH